MSVTIPDHKSLSNPETNALLRVWDHHPTDSSIKVDAPPLRVVTPLLSYQALPLYHPKYTLLLPHWKRCSPPTTLVQVFKDNSIVEPNSIEN
jgi:hypothetical protein